MPDGMRIYNPPIHISDKIKIIGIDDELFNLKSTIN